MSMTNNELIMLQALPLEIKIMKTKQRIKEWINHWGENGVYVSYSGGKDSEVLVDIARSVYPDIKIVFVNTGQELPGTLKQVLKRKKQGYNIEIIRPKLRYKDVIEKYGYPVVSKEQSQYISDLKNSKSEKLKKLRVDGNKWGRGKVSKKHLYLVDSHFKISHKCCDVLKKDPAKRYEKDTGRKPIIGTMSVESSLRKQQYLKSGCNSFEGKRAISKPLGFWKEEDIWEYIKTYNLEISEEYTKNGRDRTGCYGCLFGCHLEEKETGTNRIVELKEQYPMLHRHLITDLGYDKVMSVLGLRSGVEECQY